MGSATNQLATINRRLLIELATPPPEGSSVVGQCRALADAITDIRASLRTDADADHHSLPIEVILAWRNELDTCIDDLRIREPETWQELRRPGTWADSALRLRSILSHAVVKSYWDQVTEVRYSALGVERYLWGAR